MLKGEKFTNHNRSNFLFYHTSIFISTWHHIVKYVQSDQRLVMYLCLIDTGYHLNATQKILLHLSPRSVSNYPNNSVQSHHQNVIRWCARWDWYQLLYTCHEHTHRDKSDSVWVQNPHYKFGVGYFSDVFKNDLTNLHRWFSVLYCIDKETVCVCVRPKLFAEC